MGVTSSAVFDRPQPPKAETNPRVDDLRAVTRLANTVANRAESGSREPQGPRFASRWVTGVRSQ
jgi:hypothetical protein